MATTTTLPTTGALAMTTIRTLSGEKYPLAITGLYPTGQGTTTDAHYQLVLSPSVSYTNAYILPYVIPTWDAGPWISPQPSPGGGAPAGSYVYRLTFNLVDTQGNAIDTNSAYISGMWATDDYATLYINGTETTNILPPALWGRKQPFYITTGFVSGTNVIDFATVNSRGNAGLLVSEISGHTLPTTNAAPVTGVRLSKFRGQDFDFPPVSQPVRFSDFRGAVNYNLNYQNIAYNLPGTVQDTSVAYRDVGDKVFENSYSVIDFSSVSPDFTIRTKSASGSSETFALIDAEVDVTFTGYSQGTVTCFMRINDETVDIPTRTVGSTDTVSFSSVADYVEFFETSNATPQVVETIGQIRKLLDPYLFGTQRNSADFSTGFLFSFSSTTQSMLQQLIQVFNTTTNGAVNYTIKTIALKTNSVSIVLDRSAYVTKTIPLCYSIFTTPFGSNQPVSSTIRLQDYNIKQGDTIRFYIGPSSASRGHRVFKLFSGWKTVGGGAAWSGSLAVTVNNSLKLNFS